MEAGVDATFKMSKITHYDHGRNRFHFANSECISSRWPDTVSLDLLRQQISAKLSGILHLMLLSPKHKPLRPLTNAKLELSAEGAKNTTGIHKRLRQTW